MGFIVFEEEAFNYLDAQLENFVKRMDRIRERSEDKTMNKWLDTQDVCQTLNICPRTVQTLRDNGTLAYTQISHKTYYKPEDVMGTSRWCLSLYVPSAIRMSLWRRTNISPFLF